MRKPVQQFGSSPLGTFVGILAAVLVFAGIVQVIITVAEIADPFDSFWFQFVVFAAGVGASSVIAGRSAEEHARTLVKRDARKAVRRMVRLAGTLELARDQLITRSEEVQQLEGEVTAEKVSLILDYFANAANLHAMMALDSIADWQDLEPEMLADIVDRIEDQAQDSSSGNEWKVIE
jgi:hypothetical protein